MPVALPARSIGRATVAAVGCGLLTAAAVVPPATAAPSAVTSWVTDFATNQRLAEQHAQRWRPGPGTAASTIVVDPTQRYQKITGYGAAMTNSSAWLLTDKLDETTRRKAMTDLFSPTRGIGLSSIRVPLGASDFAVDGSYTYDDQAAGKTDPRLKDFSIDHDRQAIIPRLKQAQRIGGDLNLIGSPWSAPAWMKDGDSLNGGSLSPKFEQAYGKYLARAAAGYARAGVDLDQLTVQNEPLNSNGGYPTMTMTADQQRRVITDGLRPALDAERLRSTSILGYDHNWDVPGYPSSLLGSPTTGVAGTAWHCYGGDVVQQTVVHNAFPDAGAWMTECSGGDWQPSEIDGFQGSLYAVINATREWGQGSLLWNLALDSADGPTNGGCSNCRGVLTINDDGSYTPTVDYWALAQVSKFVRPGSVRIASSAPTDGSLSDVAFTTPEGDHVLVVNNTSDQQQTFNIAYGSRHLSVTLAAHAAGTYRWSGSPQGVRHVTGQATVDLGRSGACAPSVRRQVTVDKSVVDAMNQFLLNGRWYAYGGNASSVPQPVGTLRQLDRAGWTATASTSSSSDPASQAIDGDPATRWSSGAGMQPGDWFRLDFPDRTRLDQLTLDSTASPNDVARTYEVQASDDGSSWTTVARGTGQTGKTAIPLGEVTTRHLRIVNESSSGSWWSIHEITAAATSRSASVSTPDDHRRQPAGQHHRNRHQQDHRLVHRTATLGRDAIRVTWNGSRSATEVALWPGSGWRFRLTGSAALTVVRVG